MTAPVLCDRCNQPADADRIEVTTWADREPRYVWGWITCTTPGCVDEHGSSLVPPPDEPGQLTREDWRWIRRHNRLAEEYGRVGRLLEEVR